MFEVEEDVPAESRHDESHYIAALLREREGLVRVGLDDRVADVDAELARVGWTPQETDEAEADAETLEADGTAMPNEGDYEEAVDEVDDHGEEEAVAEGQNADQEQRDTAAQARREAALPRKQAPAGRRTKPADETAGQ